MVGWDAYGHWHTIHGSTKGIHCVKEFEAGKPCGACVCGCECFDFGANLSENISMRNNR